MRSLVLGAAAAGGVAALMLLGPPGSGVRPSRVTAGDPRPGASSTAAAPRSRCPPNTLEDDGVCVPVPRARESRFTAANVVPLQPGRDSNPMHYALPVSGDGVSATYGGAGTGPDAGTPGSALTLAAPAGARVSAVSLEGQDGPAEIVLADPGAATTATLHSIGASANRKRYVLVLRGFSPLPAVTAGAKFDGGAELGGARSTPMTLTTRLVRPDVEPSTPGALLADDANSVLVDPRNVLRPRTP